MTRLETLLRSRVWKSCEHCGEIWPMLPREKICVRCERIVEGNIRRGLYQKLEDMKEMKG